MPASSQFPVRLELMAAANDGDYLIHSPLEIAFLLRAIMQHGTLLTVYTGAGNDSFVTLLLSIEDDPPGVVFDCGPSAALNRRVLESDRLAFLTTHDRIQVQFECRDASEVLYEGKPAFHVPLPERLLRLQRREYYRLVAPAMTPLRCALTVRHEGKDVRIELKVLDISCGGIATSTNLQDPAPQPGVRYACKIELPGAGTLQATIEQRNTFELTLYNGTKIRRSGYQFVDPKEKDVALIQRYIMYQERARKERSGELA